MSLAEAGAAAQEAKDFAANSRHGDAWITGNARQRSHRRNATLTMARTSRPAAAHRPGKASRRQSPRRGADGTRHPDPGRANKHANASYVTARVRMASHVALRCTPATFAGTSPS